MMNLYLSAAEYDYHTLLKVAEMAGLAGIIGFHEAGDGYLVTFPQGENVQALIDESANLGNHKVIVILLAEQLHVALDLVGWTTQSRAPTKLQTRSAGSST